jgi:hypothetical protein
MEMPAAEIPRVEIRPAEILVAPEPTTQNSCYSSTAPGAHCGDLGPRRFGRAPVTSTRQSSPPTHLVVGQVVRVQPDTRDPDFPTLALDGWTGVIREMDSETPPLCLVEWDEATLANIPADLLQESG